MTFSYILLYKLNRNHAIWIVDVDLNIHNLKQRIKDHDTKDDCYYIISDDLDKDFQFKRFQQFKISENSKIHYVSQNENFLL